MILRVASIGVKGSLKNLQGDVKGDSNTSSKGVWKTRVCSQLPSLKLPASLHLEMDGWFIRSFPETTCCPQPFGGLYLLRQSYFSNQTWFLLVWCEWKKSSNPMSGVMGSPSSGSSKWSPTNKTVPSGALRRCQPIPREMKMTVDGRNLENSVGSISSFVTCWFGAWWYLGFESGYPYVTIPIPFHFQGDPFRNPNHQAIRWKSKNHMKQFFLHQVDEHFCKEGILIIQNWGIWF